MTALCPIEGHMPKWQLAYFRPNVGYFGHIVWDIKIYIKIGEQTIIKLIGLNLTIWAYKKLQENTKEPYLAPFCKNGAKIFWRLK